MMDDVLGLGKLNPPISDLAIQFLRTTEVTCFDTFIVWVIHARESEYNSYTKMEYNGIDTGEEYDYAVGKYAAYTEVLVNLNVVANTLVNESGVKDV